MPDRGDVADERTRPVTFSTPRSGSDDSELMPPMHTGFYRKTGKRILDLVLSLFGLILLSPLLALLCLLVRLSSPGPVFFQQSRVGKSGTLFQVLKFRSMVAGAENLGKGITTADDHRVTPLGAFLRKWKLDELPQLVNVLKGEMSLVGPRPELPIYVAGYTIEQKEVLEVRPGITDPASLRYRHEEQVLQASSDPERHYRETVLPNKLSLSLQYARNLSFARDLSLLISTVSSVVKSSKSEG